ncbi:MAG: hypothetical protein LBK47_01025 [Prevotellaceae bacterium]|jgi:hypothetical protein|nr:hypothetical protein [Prevotellaceae bacterium]
MKMKCLTCKIVVAVVVLLVSALCHSAYAQVGINTTTPDSTALLDIHFSGTGQVGVLFPNVVDSLRKAKKPNVSDGMVVFDRKRKMFYYYDDHLKEWVAMTPFGAVHDDNELIDIRPQNSEVNTLNMSLGLPAGETATAKLDVNGSVRVRKNMKVEGSDTIQQSLAVNGAATLKQSLQVNGNTTLQQNLQVAGSTTLQNPTTINSTLTVNSSINAKNDTVAAKTFVGYGITPVGGIMMWSGSTADFDASGNGKASTKMDGWALCNGANGTPNLKGRFIVGYNPDEVDYNEIKKLEVQNKYP